MYKASATNLLELQPTQLSSWLATFDTVLSDCDGTILHDGTAIPGAAAVLNALQTRAGKKVYLITNNGLKTHQELWQRSQKQGFLLPNEAHIISPTTTIVAYLKQHPKFTAAKKVYVVGNAAIERELTAAGIASFGAGTAELLDDNIKWPDYVQREFAQFPSAEIGAVIVGWDEHFNYCKMARACHILCANTDCAFLATNKDAVHKYPGYNIPGTGAIVAGIEACSERKAIEMGKPNPYVLEPLIQQAGLVCARTLMIGDCCKIDVKFAKNCGMQSMLVGTGSYNMETLRSMQSTNKDNDLLPDVYLPKLADLLPFI